MPSFQYGQTTFDWEYQVNAKLKRHYVTVERGRTVLLRGPLVGSDEQQALVAQRARWIRDKIAQVNMPLVTEAIVTGSRLRYAGRSYFTEVSHQSALSKPSLHFTASRFVIYNPDGNSIHPDVLMPLLERFYRERAQDKLLMRVRHWEKVTGLKAAAASIRLFQSRWASCDANNYIAFHPRVMELAANVQDYVIVHELCHTLEKNHTKAFWSLVTSHMPDWQQRHAVLERAVFGDAV
jgi:predicted metal-dependent hydrolase